jgi:hypothetical protein
MMRITLLFCLLLVLGHLEPAYSQMAVARLKFEDAEEAFNKGDYTTTITKLEDAEKLFGKINVPILHLRILAQDKLLQKQFDFTLLSALRKNCEQFLKDYETMEGIEEKYRQVYKILEANEKHPKTLADYEKIAQQKKEEEEKKKAIEAFQNLVFTTVFRNTGKTAKDIKLALFINGKYVGTLENDTYLALNLMPGLYQFACQPEDINTAATRTLLPSTKLNNMLIAKGVPSMFKLDIDGKRLDKIDIIEVKEKEKSKLYQECKIKPAFILNIKPL